MSDAPAREFEVECRGIEKSFNELRVLRGVDLDVAPHGVAALVGPSGSGKSTLLRCLNLLTTPDAGTIRVEGRDVAYEEMNPREVNAHRTRMGMVFQHFHLFPHMTAVGNVMEGLRVVRGLSREAARERAAAVLEDVGLGDKLDEWPGTLSGGQKQRVAIARALAMEPRIMLLDEVTSALDVEMIAGINDLLADLASRGMTMVVVTHDLGFARRVADQIHFLDEGRVIERGTPEEFLESPSTERAREFLSNVLRA